MGIKTSSSLTIDKPSMGAAAMFAQLCARQLEQKKADAYGRLRKLQDNPSYLSGDRAEMYKESIDMLTKVIDKLSAMSDQMRRVAAEKNSQFNLNVDFKRVDATVMASREDASRMNRTKLKGV